MTATGRPRFELVRFSTADELARTAAVGWLAEVEAANRADKRQSVALSGGRITQKFFSCAVEEAGRRTVSFENVHFFWADERCVPPDDSESNFRIARELLFLPLKISESQIHRVRGEESPEVAARSAEVEIRRVVSGETGEPALDLVFLGLGEDGHVASLFPGRLEGAGDSRTYCAVIDSPKPPPKRVTLTYAAISAAREVWVIASGTGKEVVLREALSLTGGTPLARVLSLRNFTKILTDIQF